MGVKKPGLGSKAQLEAFVSPVGWGGICREVPPSLRCRQDGKDVTDDGQPGSGKSWLGTWL